jgi:D-glycero-beta-D-manno-heptose-7-phosphate kinase
VVKVVDETYLLGGAANVVNNLVGLGAGVYMAGVVGNDEMGRKLQKQLKKAGVSTECVITDVLRPTAVKTRVIAHQQQVVRVDKEKNEPLSRDIAAQLIGEISKNKKELDGIIVSDYAKGVISEGLMAAIKKIARVRQIPILVDPKPQHMDWYKGVTLITPNHMEAALSVDGNVGSDGDVRRIGLDLLKKLRCDSVLLTQGKEGMTLFSKKNKINHIPTVAKKVFDVTGAGDTVIATLMLGLVSGLSLVQACLMANYAAGIVVGEVGTAAINVERLKEILPG